MTIESTALEAMSRVMDLEQQSIGQQAVHAAEVDTWRIMFSESLTMIHAQALELDSVRAQLSALRDELRRYTLRVVS